METSTRVLIMTLSPRLRKAMRVLVDENKDWELLAKCFVESITQSIVNRDKPNSTEFFTPLKDLVVKYHQENLEEIPTGFNLQKAEWKKDELWLHFADLPGKHFPQWDIVERLVIPDAKEKVERGVVILYPKESNVYYTEVTNMPRHAVVQAEEFLRLGIHSNKALQGAFDRTAINRLSSRFIALKKDTDAISFSKHFMLWWKETRQGSPVIDTASDERDLPPQKSPWKDKVKEARKDNNKNQTFKRRVKAGKREYRNAFKCARGENIEQREVYARCYSKRPEWEGWYFL